MEQQAARASCFEALKTRFVVCISVYVSKIEYCAKRIQNHQHAPNHYKSTSDLACSLYSSGGPHCMNWLQFMQWSTTGTNVCMYSVSCLGSPKTHACTSGTRVPVNPLVIVLNGRHLKINVHHCMWTSRCCHDNQACFRVKGGSAMKKGSRADTGDKDGDRNGEWSR